MTNESAVLGVIAELYTARGAALGEAAHWKTKSQQLLCENKVLVEKLKEAAVQGYTIDHNDRKEELDGTANQTTTE
jgi:hypothetical protein